jgi:hypothetical protein
MPLLSPAFIFSVDRQRDRPKPPRNRQSRIMTMADPNLLIMVGVVFCLAGFVKGMVGLGLPTVSLGLLSIIVDLPTAMALLVMPSLATNVWQALAGGQIRRALAAALAVFADGGGDGSSWCPAFNPC